MFVRTKTWSAHLAETIYQAPHVQSISAYQCHKGLCYYTVLTKTTEIIARLVEVRVCYPPIKEDSEMLAPARVTPKESVSIQ